jgi:cellobiose phosphorylase
MNLFRNRRLNKGRREQAGRLAASSSRFSDLAERRRDVGDRGTAMTRASLQALRRIRGLIVLLLILTEKEMLGMVMRDMKRTGRMVEESLRATRQATTQVD